MRWAIPMLCPKTAAMAVGACILAGCTTTLQTKDHPRPDIMAAGASQAEPVRLDSAQIQPMYRTLVAIDLANVVQVVSARNLDILGARERVRAAGGQYESAIGGLLPSIGGGVSFEDVSGVNRTVTGELVGATFTAFQPAALVQWLLNPGRAIFDVIAAKKRLTAAEHYERYVELEKLRQAVRQYYDLVFAQARVAAASEAISAARELSRLTSSRVRNGTGLTADDSRARAALAAREQDLVIAVNDFYAASLTLALTLDLDATETLVPKPDRIAAVSLVRDNVTVDEMLDIAMVWRPDLAGVQSVAAAADADRKAVLWGALAPQLQASYQYGGIETDANGRRFPLQEQERTTASAQLTLSPALFGRMRAAGANARLSELDVARKVQEIKAQIMRASQESSASGKLIAAAQRQVDAAAEAARLSQSNLKAGTMLTVDVLLAQDALNDAKQRYANAVVKYNQAQVDILAALGVLDGVDLSPSQSSGSGE